MWIIIGAWSITRLMSLNTKSMSNLVQVKYHRLLNKLLYYDESTFSLSSYLYNLTPHFIGVFAKLHTHVKLLENFFRKAFLRNKNTILCLFHCYAKIAWHETSVGHLKLSNHYLFELIKHGWIVFSEDQVIHIQANK